jgi:hypothetical protein
MITFDDRGRAPLKQYGGTPGGDYVVTTLRDGTIQLTPAVVQTVTEAAMWRDNPKVAAFLASDGSEDSYVEIDLETGRPIENGDEG